MAIKLRELTFFNNGCTQYCIALFNQVYNGEYKEVKRHGKGYKNSINKARSISRCASRYPNTLIYPFLPLRLLLIHSIKMAWSISCRTPRYPNIS